MMADWVVGVDSMEQMLDKTLLAPTKFEPLSEWIDVGGPLLDMKHLRAARNASVVRSDTSSKWAALVEKQTNAHT